METKKLWRSSALLLAIALPAQEPAPQLDPAAAGPAVRIWSPDGGERVWFRRTFALPKGVREARIVFTCDDAARVHVNGREVATAKFWTDVTVVDLDDLDRDNVVAIAAEDEGGSRALACWIIWTDANGTRRELVTDGDWRCSSVERDGWKDLEFDDRNWARATGEHASTFGRNVYNYEPTNVYFRNRNSAEADAIAAALHLLRTAATRDETLKALDEVERAAIRARAAILKREKARAERVDEPAPGADRRNGR